MDVYWCIVSHRAAGELEFLAPRVLMMAHALGLDLTVRLFYTGECDLKYGFNTQLQSMMFEGHKLRQH